jgi:hypothetical protein
LKCYRELYNHNMRTVTEVSIKRLLKEQPLASTSTFISSMHLTSAGEVVTLEEAPMDYPCPHALHLSYLMSMTRLLRNSSHQLPSGRSLFMM